MYERVHKLILSLCFRVDGFTLGLGHLRLKYKSGPGQFHAIHCSKLRHAYPYLALIECLGLATNRNIQYNTSSKESEYY